MVEEFKKVKLAETKLLQGLQDLDTMLQNAVDFTENGLGKLDKYKNAPVEYVQKEIDKICVQLSDKINAKLEEKKQEAIKIIKEKYELELEVIKQLKPIIDLLELKFSLDTVVDGLIKTIKTFADPYIKPYEDAIEFTTAIVTEAMPLIDNISSNTDELMSTPDKVLAIVQEIDPSLNLDKLQIKFTPPSISDIIG